MDRIFARLFNVCSDKAHEQERISQPPFCRAFIPEKSCKEDFARADREHTQDYIRVRSAKTSQTTTVSGRFWCHNLVTGTLSWALP